MRYRLDPLSPYGISPEVETKVVQAANGFAVHGKDGTNGVGVVAGGTTGQSLVKKSDADYDTEWKTVTGGTGTSDHAELTHLAYADSGHTGFQPAGSYLTAETDPVFTAWDKDYADLSNKPTLGTAAAKNIPATGNASATEVVYGSDTRLTDARTPATHGNEAHSSTFITAGDIPAIPDSVDDLSPSQTGNNGKFLTTNGTNASWESIPGGGDVLKVGTPVDNQVAVWTGDGTVEGDATLTFDKSNSTLEINHDGNNSIIKNGNGYITIGDADAMPNLYLGSDEVGLGYVTAIAGSGDGGNAHLRAGGGGLTSGNGGNVEISSGYGNAGDGDSGYILLQGSEGHGAGTGGDVYLWAGKGGATGSAGKVKIHSNVNDSSILNAVLDTSPITTTDKTFTFPNKTGTFALAEDLGTAAAADTGDFAAALGADDNYVTGAEKSNLHAPGSDNQDLSGLAPKANAVMTGTTQVAKLDVANTSGTLSITSVSDGGDFNISHNESGEKTLAIYGSAGNTMNVDVLDGDLTVSAGNLSVTAGTISAGGAVTGSNLSGTNTGDQSASDFKLDDLAAPDDNTGLNASTTAHGLLLKATAPAAGLYNYVGITNGETAYTNKALFDATVPSTQAFGDAAATGSATVSARRDHKHAMPAMTTVLAAVYPVGCIYTTITSTNPATVFGFGTWAAFGAGKVLVGLDSGNTAFDTVEETGGAETVTLTSAQSGVPAHTHAVASSGDHTHTTGGESQNHTHSDGFNTSGGSTLPGAAVGIRGTTGANNRGHTHSIASSGAHTHTTDNNSTANASEAHTNLQPYIVVYFFKRTA